MRCVLEGDSSADVVELADAMPLRVLQTVCEANSLRWSPSGASFRRLQPQSSGGGGSSAPAQCIQWSSAEIGAEAGRMAGKTAAMDTITPRDSHLRCL